MQETHNNFKIKDSVSEQEWNFNWMQDTKNN